MLRKSLEMAVWMFCGFLLGYLLPLSLAMAIASAFAIFVIGMMLRNRWVFKTRMRWILESSKVRTINYGAMMWRWWCWSTKPEDWIK